MFLKVVFVKGKNISLYEIDLPIGSPLDECRHRLRHSTYCHIFARPEKPEGVEEKHAYIVGSGLAALSAACFLVRDGQMPGSHIHILEAMDIAGGACDGIFDPSRGYIMRGGREMENHFECLWDLFRSIPSLEVPNASVLDEFYWLNKHDPNYSLCRATEDCGDRKSVV